MTLCARPSGSDGVFISVKMVLQGYSEAVIYWCEKSSLKTAIQLLNLYSEAVIYRCKSDENTPLSGGSYKKTDENVLWGGDFIDIKPMKTY